MAAQLRRRPFPAVPLPIMGNNNHLDNRDPVGCHVEAESLLTTEAEFHNFSGFFKWAVILLVLTYVCMNVQLINKHEFFSQFGDPSAAISLFCKDPYGWPALNLVAASNVFIIISLFTELLMTRSRTCEVVGMIVHCVNLLALLAFPVAIILSSKSITPVGSMLTLFIYVVLFFKLLSYTIINSTYRNARGNARVILYPSNLHLKDIYYFVAAPTLCYQVNYPKTPHFRLLFFLARVGEVVILFHLMVALVQQLILPDIQRSMKPIWEMEASHFLEYILKLAVVTNFIWLIFFYWFFHSFLNALAELLYFADRDFYWDWWNADSIQTFWTKWNRPAHNWFFRHMYMPLRICGYEDLYVQAAIFLFSTVVFEVLIAVPLGMYKLLICKVMSIQFLLILILEKLLVHRFGNFLMWLHLFFGLPLVLIFYLHDYYIQGSFQLGTI